ncbi:MAG: dihydrofolate reductase [Leeuwenhoekiella sp.]
MIVLIAAASANNALGKNGDLLWHLPDDFKRFKRLTMSHPIIMGRKTFESLPGLLPKRKHIVITRNEDYNPEGADVAHSLEQAIALAQNDTQIYVIGGGEIYKMALTIANKIELTRVHATFKDADAYFPEIDEKEWEIIESKSHSKDDRHAYAFDYLTYVKR